METTHADQSMVATRPHGRRSGRELAFWSGLGLVPATIGAGVAALSHSRRAGWIAGGASLLGLAAVRWQLERMFKDEPDYVVEQTIGRVEIRRYMPRVEARTWIDERDTEAALERGFNRLAAYIFGGNRGGERLPMTCPVVTRKQGDGYAMSFVMPPERAIPSLPRPSDSRIELVDVPEQRVAVLRYHGGYTKDVVDAHEQELSRLATEAGQSTSGEPIFAGFDAPSTLPFLRRSEVWREIV